MKDTRKLEKEIEGAIETTTLNAFAPLSLTRGELERMGSGEGDNVYEALFSGMGDCDPGYYTREAAKESLSMLTMGQGLSDWRASMAECCRKLGMGEAGYHAMERVLRSAAIDLERCWGAYGRVVARCAPALAVVTEFGPMAIIDGDGITVPVDSVANPCVERTRQSSSDSSKRERVTAVKYTGTSLSCAAGGYEKSVLLRLEPHSACGGVDALEGSAHVSEAVRLEESGIRAAQTLFEEEVIGEGPRVGAPDGSPERERCK